MLAALHAQQAPAAAHVLRIGLVANIDGLGDGSLNELSAKAVQAASVRLHALVDIRASPDRAAYIPSLQAMAAQGYDLVIAVGRDEEQAVGAVARRYPRVRFAIVDGSYRAAAIGSLRNVAGLVFADQEAGYLAGFLAGLVVPLPGPFAASNTVSTISRSLDPASVRYIVGFRAGVRAADPDVHLLAGFSNSVASPARCETLARSQIAAGSSLVFTAAGSCSSGAIGVAGEAGVWTVGAGADSSPLGTTVLVSAVDRADRAVALTLDALAHGTFETGRDIEFGLAQNAVSLVSLKRGLPRRIRERLNAVANRVRAGRISIPTRPARDR